MKVDVVNEQGGGQNAQADLRSAQGEESELRLSKSGKQRIRTRRRTTGLSPGSTEYTIET